MENFDKEKIVDKIRKLLALSTSSNEHEAALALENANKLLLKYNLEMSDIDEQVNLNNVIEDTVAESGRIMSWKINLMTSLMDLNNCRIIIHSVVRGEKKIKAIGRKCNIEVSMAMYDYVLQTMERKLRSERAIDKFSFRLGFSRAIQRKVAEILENRNKVDIDPRCTALVVQEKALVRSFMRDNYKNLRTSVTKTSFGDAGSYYSGLNAGNSVSLNSQIR